MRYSKKLHYNEQEKKERLMKYANLDEREATLIAQGLDCLTFSMLREVKKQIGVFAKGKDES
jgi:hypothetical protein